MTRGQKIKGHAKDKETQRKKKRELEQNESRPGHGYLCYVLYRKNKATGEKNQEKETSEAKVQRENKKRNSIQKNPAEGNYVCLVFVFLLCRS